MTANVRRPSHLTDPSGAPSSDGTGTAVQQMTAAQRLNAATADPQYMSAFERAAKDAMLEVSDNDLKANAVAAHYQEGVKDLITLNQHNKILDADIAQSGLTPEAYAASI